MFQMLMLVSNVVLLFEIDKKMKKIISENSRKSYVVGLANDVFCNFPPEALMNTLSSYKAVYWFPTIF